MEKDEKSVWSTDDIRSRRNEWSLAADSALFEHIEALSQNIVARSHSVLQSVESLGDKLNETTTNISDTNNKFLLLANTQFVENRVYEDDEAALSDSGAAAQAQPSSSADEIDLSKILEDAYNRGVALVDENYSEFQLPGSDSEDEDVSSPSRLVLRSHNPYSSRRLPHVIGSADFFKDDKVGLGSEPGSSESSESSSLSEESEEESPPQHKPYASSSSGSVESIGSMDESKSASPADDLFGRYRDSINSTGKLQPGESNVPNQHNHPETICQNNQSRRSDSEFQESVKPSNVDPFSHHMNTAPSLFAPPPFNAEESSEESDNESLFAYGKQNHNRLLIDDDEEENGAQDVQSEKRRNKSHEKAESSSRSESQETDRFNSSVPKDQPPQKKIPAGAVSIFPRNMNPFPHPSGPPLFPRDEDSDGSEPTQGASSDDGFSVSQKSSSDFGISKPSPPVSKPPARKSLFDDDDEDESTKDFDSLLFQPTVSLNKNTSSTHNTKKPVSNLFSDSTEDIFSSSTSNKPDIFSAKKQSNDIFSNSQETNQDSKRSISNAEASKKSDLFESPSSVGQKSSKTTKPVSDSLFDSNSDDELFPAAKTTPKLASKTESKKESLFDDSDTVDFSKTSPLIVNKKDPSSKKPFLDLFDNDEDDDSFLFSSNISKESKISASKPLETPKKPLSQDNQKKIKDQKDDLFPDDKSQDDDGLLFSCNASKDNKISASKPTETPKKPLLQDKKEDSEAPKEDDLFSEGTAQNDDSILFSTNASKDKTSASKTVETPKKPVSQDSKKTSEISKEHDLFSSDKAQIEEDVFNKIKSPSIFDDEDESSIYSKTEEHNSSITSDTTPTIDDSKATSNKVDDPLGSKFSDVENTNSLNDASIITSKNDVNNAPTRITMPVETQQSDDISSFKETTVKGSAKPVTPPKPVAGNGLSEIDKLKKKLVSSGSDEISSDDSSASARPKVTSPGKLAANRGQNINIAALMPGYKHRSIRKSESTLSSESSASSSEPAPLFGENSSHSPVESASTNKPVPKSTSLPSSLSSQNASPVEQTDAALFEESSGYSHFLANDTMKKRARISVKRRPPSQKARQEAAQASLTSNTFSHHDIDDGETPQPTADTFANESKIQNITASHDNAISQLDRNSKNNAVKSTSNKRESPLRVTSNSLFDDDTEESEDIFGKKKPLAESAVPNKLPSSAKVIESQAVAKSVPSVFEDSHVAEDVESNDLFSGSIAKKSDQVAPEVLKSQKSFSTLTGNAKGKETSSKLVPSLFDDSPPPLDAESDDLFSISLIEKSKNSSPGDKKLPKSTEKKDPKSDDLFSKRSVEKLGKEGGSPDVSRNRQSPNMPGKVKEKQTPPISVTSIFDDSPPPLDEEGDELFGSRSVEKSKKEVKESSKVPESAGGKQAVSKSVSSIFDDSPPPLDEESPALFDDSTTAKSKKSGMNKGPSKVPENSNEKQTLLKSVSSIFDDSPSPDHLEANDPFNVSSAKKNISTDSLKSEKVSKVPENAKEKNINADRKPVVSSIFEDSPPPSGTEPTDLFSESIGKSENENSTQDSFKNEKLGDESVYDKSVTSHDSDSNKLFGDSVSKLKSTAPTITVANSSESKSSSSILNEGDSSNLFGDNSKKVPESAADDDLFSSSKKEVHKQPSKVMPQTVQEKKTEPSKLTPKSLKTSLTAENPLADDLSDEDLFGSYSTKPAISVLNKFKPSSNLKNSPSEPTKNKDSSKSEKEEDLFFESDNNIEKLFPKVKIGAKKSRIDPLSEVSQDYDEDDDSFMSPNESEEKQKSDTVGSKRMDSIDDSSLLDDSFKTAPSVHSDLDKMENVSSGESNLTKEVEKHADLSIEHSTTSEVNNSKVTAPLFAENDDLFENASQQQSKMQTAPTSKNPLAKNIKPISDLFGNDEEEDDLFKSMSKSSSKKISSGSSRANVSKSSSSGSPGSAAFGVSKKGGSDTQEMPKSQLFDDEDADDLFSSTPKMDKSKTAAAVKKKVSTLPKLNTSSIFGDDEDSDTELFTSSLKKK